MSELIRSAVTTHVLDTAAGTPAAGVPVVLERLTGAAGDGTADVVELIATGSTDPDGRVGTLGPTELARGTYRLTFDTGAYFAAGGRSSFYPFVSVVFTVDPSTGHHHVPLLLSPFAYTTYLGS